MLTYFRRIRNGLLDGGATRKYLLYAIGEISLVVIGILIALQINNWNEWRKERVKEEKVLIELAETIESNCLILERAKNSCDNMNVSSELIISVLKNKLSYADSLRSHFYRASLQGGDLALSLSQSGYEALKNVGIDIIRRDSLKILIINLFETTIPSIKVVKDRHRSNYPNYNSHILMIFTPGKGKLIPLEFNQVLDDHYFFSIIKTIKEQRDEILNKLSYCLKDSQHVLHLIKNELNK